MVVHLLVLIGVLEVIGAAIGGIQTCQIEIAASLTWGFAIALDLPPFALVTVEVWCQSFAAYSIDHVESQTTQISRSIARVTSMASQEQCNYWVCIEKQCIVCYIPRDRDVLHIVRSRVSRRATFR